jgi:HD-like signal output (HDOD) protein
MVESELLLIVKTLPASPHLLAELGQRLQGADVEVDEITSLLKRDAALTARIIGMANSAVYARAQPASSLEEAVACVGYREVYRLVGAVAATQMADEPLRYYGVDGLLIRENALFVALVMEELALAIGEDSRAAYTMGLLRSIGKIALDRLARKNPAIVPYSPEAGNLADWERSNWQSSNVEVSETILHGWHFPQETIAAIRHHYEPAGDSDKFCHLLNLSAGAADLRGFPWPGEEGFWQFTAEDFSVTGLDEGKLVWAGQRAYLTLQKISSALG